MFSNLDDLMSKTMKQTEDRVSDVKRRAEEAVSDVKRQAVVELQKAVRAAEEKANEAVGQTQSKIDKAVMEARRQAIEETLSMINRQSDSSEVCKQGLFKRGERIGLQLYLYTVRIVVLKQIDKQVNMMRCMSEMWWL